MTSIVGEALGRDLLALYWVEDYPRLSKQARDIPMPARIYNYMTSHDGADMAGNRLPSFQEIGARPAWRWAKLNPFDTSRVPARVVQLSGGALLWITLRSPLYGARTRTFQTRISNGWTDARFVRAIDRLASLAAEESRRMAYAELAWKAYKRIPDRDSEAFRTAVAAEEKRSGYSGSFADMTTEAAEHWAAWLQQARGIKREGVCTTT